MASVISLGDARSKRKAGGGPLRKGAPKPDQANREQLYTILHNHRQALGRLFESGVIFHREGSRAARQLLTAHELILSALDLLDELSEPQVRDKAKKLLLLRKKVQRAAVLTARTQSAVRTLVPDEDKE